MTGIDVSQHQGTINWNLAKQQIDFAILRLGWIGNKNNHTIDTQFERNFSECKRLGIPVGVYVYVYSSSVETVKSGANWAVQKLVGKQLDLPVYIDMEDNSIEILGKDKLTEMVIEFNKIIEASGRWAGVYANKNWFDNYLHKEQIKAKYTTWIAHYGINQNTYNGQYDILQYSDKGSIAGINGKVDMNIMYRELLNEIKGNSSATEEKKEENNNDNGGSLEMARVYQNGSTPEAVYADTELKNKIGSLNPGETAEYLSIDNDRPLVRYKVDNTNIYKCGYVQWKGGCK